MTPEQARAERLRLRVARWHHYKWQRHWGPLYGGRVDDPRVAGVLLPYLSGTIEPLVKPNEPRRYVITPAEIGTVILTPSHGHIHWHAEECAYTANLGMITLFGFVFDVCLSIALSDIRLILASEIRKMGKGRAA